MSLLMLLLLLLLLLLDLLERVVALIDGNERVHRSFLHR